MQKRQNGSALSTQAAEQILSRRLLGAATPAIRRWPGIRSFPHLNQPRVSGFETSPLAPGQFGPTRRAGPHLARNRIVNQRQHHAGMSNLLVTFLPTALAQATGLRFLLGQAITRRRSYRFCAKWQGRKATPASADDVSQDLSSPGPYVAGWAEVSVTFSAIEQGAAIDRTIQARVYYPALAPGGQNAALDPSGGPYPAIAFGHGFGAPITRYTSTSTHLATRGFIVIATKSQNGPLPSHSQYADDLIATLNWLEIQNGQAASRFFQNVDTAHFGVAGHSMGGGASLLAADRDPGIVAVANLAAAETFPSAINAMAGIAAPVLLVAGSEDSITPPHQHQGPMYNNGSGPRQLAMIRGGYHCGFVDTSPWVGSDRGSISRGTQLTITRRLLTAWFLLYLQGDVARWTTVWGPGLATDAQVTYTTNDGMGL